MRINVMKDGDEVISVTPNYIAVKRCNGEVDLIPLVNDPNLGLRIMGILMLLLMVASSVIGIIAYVM